MRCRARAARASSRRSIRAPTRRSRTMRAGLPVATLFSGGIDSTLVAHYARQYRPETPGYFVGNTKSPDFRYAADYAAQTGFDLRMVPFDPESRSEERSV